MKKLYKLTFELILPALIVSGFILQTVHDGKITNYFNTPLPDTRETIIENAVEVYNNIYMFNYHV